MAPGNLNWSSAGDELDKQHDDSQHQQNVDIGANRMETYQTYQPQHQENHKDRPKHLGALPIGFFNCSVSV
jgi:hypothetical protein